MKKLLLVTLAAMTLLSASAFGRVVVVHRGYYRPFGWYGGFCGFYGPGFYGPGYYGSYYHPPNAGQIKFDSPVKDAEVFIDGAYAGRAGKLKTITMRPGSYNIELRAPGRMRYAERVYVVAGKTVRLHPELGLSH